MSSSEGGTEPATLSPEDAFETLGNDTRLMILQVLGEADRALTFTELRDRLGVRQGGEFNYHLDKVVDKFVSKSDEGYSLNRPGSRVVQAVLSVAVPGDPVIEPTPLDQDCYHCGASTIMIYDGSHIMVYCTKCPGNYDIPNPALMEFEKYDTKRDRVGFLGGYSLPPAGGQELSGIELLRAGTAWHTLNRLASGIGMCPRCSARLDTSVEVCETHNAGEGVCDVCHIRYAVIHYRTCTNCSYDSRTLMGRMLLGTTELLHFITDHDINPINPETLREFVPFLDEYEEEVLSVEPFEGRFTFRLDDDTITLTVDGNLNVLAVEPDLRQNVD